MPTVVALLVSGFNNMFEHGFCSLAVQHGGTFVDSLIFTASLLWNDSTASLPVGLSQIWRRNEHRIYLMYMKNTSNKFDASTFKIHHVIVLCLKDSRPPLLHRHLPEVRLQSLTRSSRYGNSVREMLETLMCFLDVFSSVCSQHMIFTKPSKDQR